MRSLQQGDRGGSVWRPGETDVSIRPGWFYHAAEDGRVRTADDLVELYFTSVGRNSKLLLNVPPDRRGLLHERDVASLRGMRANLDSMFAEDLARGARTRWRVTGRTTAELEVTFAAPVAVGVLDLREPIEDGQVVARYRVEGRTETGWEVLARGTTIGYRRLVRVEAQRVAALRVHIEDADGSLGRLGIRCFGTAG